MKKIILFAILFFCLPAVCWSGATWCPLFPLVDILITPLPVGDDMTYGVTSPMVEVQKQITKKAKEYREQMEKYRDKLGTDLSSSGSSFELPEIKSPERAGQLGIDVFDGTADPEGKKGTIVDLTNPNSIQKALDDFVLVSNITSVAEEQMVSNIKERFFQQAFAEVLARVLYYKHELAEIKKMEEDIVNASADTTTAGVISLANRVAELKNRVRILQQKTASLALEMEALTGIYGQKSLTDELQE